MKKRLIFFPLLLGLLCGHLQVNAQINVLDKIKNKANDRINQQVDQKIDQGLDSIENNSRKNEDQTNESAAEKQQTQTSQTQQAGTQKLESYSKYDFVPGEKILFYDDFTSTAVGDFPANWNTNASGEVVNTNLYAGNWFKLIGDGCISLEEGLKLPDNYTVEFDVIGNSVDPVDPHFQFGFYMYYAENPTDLNEGGAVPGKGGIKMNFGDYRADYSAYDEVGYTINGEKESAAMDKAKKYRLSFWVQKTRLRVYLNEEKIFDLPKVFKADFRCNMFRFQLWNNGLPMISNFRVAAGLPDMRNKLLTEGKLVSYGIYFDVNKDVVKPESYATIKTIADVLVSNPEVRIKIVGHTDADGNDAANLDLSKRRALAVKNELTTSFAINASRIMTDGKGESQAVAPNDTPLNKALNRRVEFIKQ